MRVGTSGVVVAGLRVHQDHPHACGDKFFDLATFCVI